MTVTTLKKSASTFTFGDYTIQNNDWGAKDYLKNGKDYTQTVSYDSVTSKVTMNWNYPNQQSPNAVYGYPEIFWGDQYPRGAGTRAYVNQIKNIKSLIVEFDTAIASDPNNFNVMAAVFMSSNSKMENDNGTVAELCINLHNFPFMRAANTGYKYEDPYFSGTIWIKPNHTPPFIIVQPTVDMFSGSIDFALILKHLVQTGVIKDTSYIAGVELGSEPVRGSGSLTVNKFVVTAQIDHAPTGAATIKGLSTWGTTMAINNTIKDADGISKFSYAWQNDKGTLSANPTYTLTNSDISTKVWATVSYTDKRGNFHEIKSNVIDVTVSTKSSTVNDLLTGTVKTDKLSGLAGNDTLIGGLGKDSLTGGVGADVFKFNSVNDSSTLPKQADTITDFKHAQGDKIDLSAIGAFTFIGTAAFDTDATGQLRFDAKTSTLYASTNADAAPEFAIVLSGVKTLVADDFIF